MNRVLAGMVLVFAVSACREEVAAIPEPVAMTREAMGYYCQMDVLEHEGPRAQIHLAQFDHPIWFSQVRDAVAFTRLPEETAEVRAIYVSDMGNAADWADPGAENWVAADAAHFVIGSRRAGGMGAPEAVPFSEIAAAEAFAADHGGHIVGFADIPDDYVLAPVEIGSRAGAGHAP